MTSPDPLSDDVWRSVRAAPAIRPTQVRAGRERLASGSWPSPLQLADCMLAAWFRRLVGSR